MVLYLVQPDYMKILFEESIGIIAVVVSAVMAGVGFLWLRKLMAIEV